MIAWNVDVSQTDERKLLMDIFIPEGDKLRGVLLFLHGGGFIGGRKEQFMGLCAAISLETGWICASLDYRLATQAAFPAQMDDVDDAVQYLIDRSAKMRIDTNRIVLAGGSPGGCMAAQNVLMRQTGVRHCILLNGIVDIPAFVMRNPEERENVSQYIPNQEQWTRLSPHTLMDERTEKTSFLMIHGEKDTVVFPEDVQKFAEALRRKGASVEVIFLKNEGHAWFNAPEKQPFLIELISRYIAQI